ncbi:hypothetical protein BCR39DRAFT_526476 [Naematelia encephala]|uniref:Zn(2)-C6 fungal-type domain-containing protein n=1 Tax=Naematelia encephala TaxID=71784 RepID=A0A1Y2B992_9TREE|nr:hypothetical protein BCR39DRAFT_526476 [Naematelia encephala]
MSLVPPLGVSKPQISSIIDRSGVRCGLQKFQMHGTDGESSVLRCGHCNKPFDKQSTLKRHGYYCRSRSGGSTSITRPRSCIACARRKAGCDNMRPECSRCSSKSIQCHYPANKARTTRPGTQHGNNGSTDRGRQISSSIAQLSTIVDDRQETNGLDTTGLDGALVLPDPDFANLGLGSGEEYFEWINADIGFDFMNTQTTEHHLSPGPSAMIPHSTHLTDQRALEQQNLFSSMYSLPTAPSLAVQTLIRRPKMQPGEQRIANLILHTLKSYPLMMLRHNTLPPFIHPSLVTPDADNVHMESLTNCISLVHMISSGTQWSRRLFWKNVRLECEHLHQDYAKLNKWELLAAIQAVTIYILIRLDEGETDHNNIDFLLVKAVTVIAQQLHRTDITCHTQCALCDNGLEMSWKEWIYRESRRRLGVVCRVINMLVYFDPASMCDAPTDLILAPLPAKKQLWEAGDEFEWKAESQRGMGLQTAFGIAADGSIVRLDEGRLSCNDVWVSSPSLDARTLSRSTASWEEWCSGIDGFGGLVMLAASLIV